MSRVTVIRFLLVFAFVSVLLSCIGLSEPRHLGDEQSAAADRGTGPEQTADTTYQRILRSAAEASPTETLLLREGESVVALVHDLDGGREMDAALLTVRIDSEETIDGTLLFKPGLPPAPNARNYHFLIEYYLGERQSAGDESPLLLGSFPAVRDFSLVVLGRSDSPPVAVASQFYSDRGSTEVWAVFQRRSPPTLLRLDQNPNADFETIDIDGDGILEVVTFDSRLEAGRGYETYLTLYRLDSDGFVANKTINVVRNLRGYLNGVREDILAKRWEAIASRSAEFMDVSPPESLDKLFPRADTPWNERASLEDEAPTFGSLAELGIEEILLPELLESPFDSVAQRGAIALPFNVVCCEGALFSFELTVRFRANPFEGVQFELVPEV